MYVFYMIYLCFFQKHHFILMYEERFVDVASYVCHILDQIPAFPLSPMYLDWRRHWSSHRAFQCFAWHRSSQEFCRFTHLFTCSRELSPNCTVQWGRILLSKEKSNTIFTQKKKKPPEDVLFYVKCNTLRKRVYKTEVTK